jgi:hypothetical protein
MIGQINAAAFTNSRPLDKKWASRTLARNGILSNRSCLVAKYRPMFGMGGASATHSEHWPVFSDYSRVIRRSARNKRYSLGIVLETNDANSGTVALRILRS